MFRAQRLLYHAHWRHRWVLRLVVALVAAAGILVAAAGIMVAVDRAFFSEETQVCVPQTTQTSRPKLQRILDGVVGGPSKLAPGATAYVSWPHGSWLGAAGVADTSTCARMPVDARMRLESVSKIYTATRRPRAPRRKSASASVCQVLPGYPYEADHPPAVPPW